MALLGFLWMDLCLWLVGSGTPGLDLLWKWDFLEHIQQLESRGFWASWTIHSSSSGGVVCRGAEPLAGGGGCFPVTLLPSYHSGQCRHALQFVLSDLSILQIFTVLGAGDTAVDPASMVPAALEGVTRETRYLSFPLWPWRLKEEDRGLWGSASSTRWSVLFLED